MQSRCPDCRTTLQIERPGTDPAARVTCTGCGNNVRPGAFRCSRCEVELQVDLSLLPDGGARDACPSCGHEISVPPLREAASPPEAPPPLPAGPAAPRAASPLPAAAPAPAEEMESESFDVGSLDDGEESFDLGSLDEEEPEPAPDADVGATRRLDAAALQDAARQTEADAGATMRLDAGALSSAADPDATGSVRLAPGSPPAPEAPVDDDTGSTRRLDLSKIAPEAPAAGAPGAPPPQRAGSAIQEKPVAPMTPSPPQRAGSAIQEKPIAPMTPSRPKRTSSAVRSRPVSPPPAARRSRATPALLGLLLGALVVGGAGYGTMVSDLWIPAPFPFEEMIPLQPMLARAAILGVAGGIVGLLLGALLGGSRRR